MVPTVPRAIRACVALLILAACLAATAPSAGASTRGNTQLRLPASSYLGDIDGDHSADLLQVARNKLFAYRTDYAGTPILHKYFSADVSRLVLGDFTTGGREHGKNQVCAILADSSLSCYAISDDGRDLWWWFSQPSFIAAGEHAVVGDFDGDGADDILVYKPSTGAIRMFTLSPGGGFHLMPDFALGNLAGAPRANKQLLAGEFGQAAGRADLLLYDRSTGQIGRYDSVTDAAGKKTFWWAFTTGAGAVSPGSQLSVARIEDSPRDGVVARNPATGAVALERANPAGAGLTDAAGAVAGQLPVTTHAGRLYFDELARFPGEPGGTTRDDALFYDTSTGLVRRFDARWDGTRNTYWWAYDKRSPALQTGWSGVTRDTWTVVQCKFSDVAARPEGSAFWRDHFTAGTGGVADYFWDMSYGSRDLYGPRILGPFTMDISAAEAARRMSAKPQTWKRQTAVAECKDAATRAGATVPDSRTILYLNATAGGGASGGYVVADPTLNSPTALGHEMSHVYGLNDSADDAGNWYGDPHDVMSAMNVLCYAGDPLFASADAGCLTGGVSAPSGPGLDAGNRIALGLLPAGRVRLLSPGGARQTVSLDITALDRPEASASAAGAGQAVRIPIPPGALAECVTGNTCSTSGNYYTVELREPRGWDRSFARSAVEIHKVALTNDSTQTFLETRPSSDRLAGSTYRDPNITVKVDSLDEARGVARVTVTY